MRRVSAVLAVLVLSSASLVRADDAAEARFFDALGRRAYAAGRWEEALSYFLDSQTAAPSTSTTYNIAVSAEQAHHDALAYASYESFLALPAGDATSARRTEAETRRAHLAERLALVHVTSSPVAEIWVDRRELGSFGRTPHTLVLEPGEHTIELSADDHETATLHVTATRGALVEVAGSLVSYVGRVRVDVVPATASLVAVSHDASTIELAAGEETELPVGRWRIEARADGYVAGGTRVNVRRDAATEASITLERVVIPSGRLLVSADRVHARVRVDGELRGETPARIDGVPAGSHVVAIEADGYLSWEQTVDVLADRSSHVSVTLVPSP